jgi:transposase
LRTLQRRVKGWRATEGPAKEVFFDQVHHPGRLGASDFTHMTSLGVTIGGQLFDHLVYHFVLTYSNWEAVTICFSESFESLSDGLQNALWELGGVPERHRSDRMSLAVNNLSEKKKFTERYEALMKHYGLAMEKTQAGQANENGDVEQSHRRF